MGSLSNLYISQSYQSLLHFGTDTSATATETELQDGIGNGLGVYLNTLGELKATTSISSSTIEATNLVIKNKIELTGSIDIDGPVTASNAFIENDLIVSGTLFANKVVTLIESSSIIFSSGSNILGDSVLDTQTLNGTIIMSGSSQLTGSMQVSADISSSTLNGMGNVNAFVTSIQASTSSLNLYTASAENKFTAIQASTSSLNNYTASADNKFLAIQASTASLNNFTASQQPSFDALNAFTASQNTKNSTLGLYTASIDSQFVQVGASTSSLNTFSASAQYSINALSALTASSNVTTGSNTFTGKQTYSSSVVGQVIPLVVSSSATTMDCSLGNFFTLQLLTSSINLTPSNIQAGQTITLRLIQPSTPGTLTTATSIKFPQGQTYSPTAASGAIDILTFVSFDTSSLNAVATYKMV
jgi:cytoskeletal protein CcmA (bactofilin family)